jgi:TRAP-type C4-dicarboxylate transport system permease small subunit
LINEKKRIEFLQRAEKLGHWFENCCLAALLIGMVFLASSQIFLRNFLGSGFPWADEALRLMVLWLAMLGAVAAARDDRQIAIDVLSRFMKKKLQLLTLAAMNLLTSIVSIILSWHCFVFVSESYSYKDLVLNDLPAWIFQSILPLAFFLLAYRYFIWALRRISIFFTEEDSMQ